MSENKSLEAQAIGSNDTSSKFLGVSLIFHALLVLLVIYLNYPLIKQKFNPQPESVAVEVKAPDKVTTPAPAVTEATKPVEKVEPKVEAKKEEKPVVAKKPVVKDNKKLAKLKMEEFKDEEKLTSANIKTPAPVKVTKKVVNSKSTALPEKKAASAQTTTLDENDSDVLVPKATITEITETPVNEDGIPLPEIAEESSSSTEENSVVTQGLQSGPGTTSLQQMARSELIEETVEENTSITEVRQTPAISRPAPSAGEIRSVTAFRQRPGNPLPRYSDFERLQRHEGQVTYLAYVTEEGRLTDFILAESSGHANLDGKTLDALKGWKFYPGQEGWVEIPQVWVLSGEPEQLPSQLRR